MSPTHTVEDLLHEIRGRGAEQQPDWPDPAQTRRVRAALAGRPALVRPEDLRALGLLLARVAEGRALVVQSGD
ncbi:3-deoxy-7-phosphoheptulonate synthase, partial [Streptomyces sp. NPDC054835]